MIFSFDFDVAAMTFCAPRALRDGRRNGGLKRDRRVFIFHAVRIRAEMRDVSACSAESASITQMGEAADES
jgi:hypothetical protein